MREKKLTIMSLITLILLSGNLQATEIIKHKLICGDYGGKRIVEVNAKGDITWEYPNVNDCKDLWVLPNKSVLFCARGGNKKGYRVMVVNRNKEIVFEYKGESKIEIHTCHFTPTGNILFVESRNRSLGGQIVEMTIKGKKIRTIPLKTKGGSHFQTRHLRLLENGNFLACHTGEGQIREYDSKGKVLSEWKIKRPMTAIRLKNGNTIVSCDKGTITEYDKDKKVVREITKENAPKDCKKFRPAGIQILPNGNIISCNAVMGGNISMIEFDKDNKVIDTTKTKIIGPVVRLQILDTADNSMR